MVDAKLAIVVAVVSGLGGALIAGGVALKVAAAERKERRHDELGSALAAFGAALDRLFLEIDQLPQPSHRWSTRVLERIEARPTVGWLSGLVSRRIFGRELWRALDGLIQATNRLLVVAPESVLPSVLKVNELLGEFERRGPDWREDWLAARDDVLVSSREHLKP